MGYNITISRISNDFKKSKSISRNDWESCSIPNELEFVVKESYPNYYLEVKNINSEEYIPCFWISTDFQTVKIDSAVFLINNELEKYAIHIASKIKGIIFGQEGELFFIPNFGKIEPQKRFLEQNLVTIMELSKNELDLNKISEIRDYIKTKFEKVSHNNK